MHYGIMGYVGYDPSEESEALITAAIMFAIGFWGLSDAKRRKYHKPFNFGELLILAFPVTLAVYLVDTRRAKGLLLAFSLCVVTFIPWAVGWLAYLANSAHK